MAKFQGGLQGCRSSILTTDRHSENALHVLRLFAAGVFDKFPRLKLIIGHMGEMLPFQLDRIIRVSDNQWPMAGVKLGRKLRQVWDENIWITTSGMFAVAPMATIMRQCKPDRILYSVDVSFPLLSEPSSLYFACRSVDSSLG